MKPRTIATILALALMAYSMSGCATTETIVTNPDGTSVTIRQTGPAPGSVEAAALLAGKVIAEK